MFSMSWRRFRALLLSMSSNSRWYATLRETRSPTAANVRRLTDPDEIEAYFAGIG